MSDDESNVHKSYSDLLPPYRRGELIQALREFAVELDESPTQRQMDSEGPVSASTYQDRFGSWNEALTAAGLEHNAPPPGDREGEANPNWRGGRSLPDPNYQNGLTDERVLEHLRNFADEIDHTPSAREMEAEGLISAKTVQNHFGSWNRGLEFAGLEVTEPSGGGYSERELIEQLQQFAVELGHAPTKREMDSDGPCAAYTYQDRFGSWNDALVAAGLEYRAPPPSQRQGKDNPRWKGGREDYYGGNWQSQRRAALERDSRTCQRCGTTEAEHREQGNGSLHVHHIRPIRKFGDREVANQLENLITLCRSCHGALEGLPIDNGER